MNKNKYVFVLMKNCEVLGVFSSIPKAKEYFKGYNVVVTLEMNNKSACLIRGGRGAVEYELWGYISDVIEYDNR